MFSTSRFENPLSSLVLRTTEDIETSRITKFRVIEEEKD
jgi:hypothetical protein